MTQEKEMRLSGLTILVVDDAPDNRLLVSRFLTIAGAEVKLAASASEGITMALSNCFSLILMDLQMPGMDGYEAVRRLRNLRYEGPIIALTAHAMVSERNKCLSSGFDQYLTKPISRALLIETISQLAWRVSGPDSDIAFTPPADTPPDRVPQHVKPEENQSQSRRENSPKDPSQAPEAQTPN